MTGFNNTSLRFPLAPRPPRSIKPQVFNGLTPVILVDYDGISITHSPHLEPYTHLDQTSTSYHLDLLPSSLSLIVALIESLHHPPSERHSSRDLLLAVRHYDLKDDIWDQISFHTGQATFLCVHFGTRILGPFPITSSWTSVFFFCHAS